MCGFIIITARFLSLDRSRTFDLRWQRLTHVTRQNRLLSSSNWHDSIFPAFVHSHPIKQFSYAHCFRNFCAAFNEWPVSPTDKTEARTCMSLIKLMIYGVWARSSSLLDFYLTTKVIKLNMKMLKISLCSLNFKQKKSLLTYLQKYFTYSPLARVNKIGCDLPET